MLFSGPLPIVNRSKDRNAPALKSFADALQLSQVPFKVERQLFRLLWHIVSVRNLHSFQLFFCKSRPIINHTRNCRGKGRQRRSQSYMENRCVWN